MNSVKYTNWRAAVDDLIKGKGWNWKRDAGDGWNTFIQECIELQDFPVGAKGILSRPSTEETKGHYNAINELLLDCLKKRREAVASRKRAAAKEELEEELAGDSIQSDAGSQEPAHKRVKYTEGKPLFFFVLDPEVDRDRHLGEWIWNQSMSMGITTLYEGTINELHRKISAKIPNGRSVHEIIGALENARPGSETAQPSDVAHLRSDDDVDTFLRLTEAKPIKLLIILHRKIALRNTPPPPGEVNDGYYFNPTRFDGPEYHLKKLDDSDEETSQKPRVGMRVWPTKDKTFKARIAYVRRQIRHQEQHLRMLC